MPHPVKCAICQMQVDPDPARNIDHACALIAEAAGRGAAIVILPEMFHIPYATAMMRRHAEAIPGPLTTRLAAAAHANGVILIGGSMAERDGEQIYNTCVFFGPDGALWGKYRKIHLFDVDIPGKVSFQESAVLSAGHELLVKKTALVDFSVMICYDARFPELFRLMTAVGAQLVVIPASFSIPTGEAHWELTLRTRAIDHQVFIAAASAARHPGDGFQPYGHSLIINPWGQILAAADTSETIILANLDLDRLQAVRAELPLLAHTRGDLYRLSPTGLQISVI